jgi:expansin
MKFQETTTLALAIFGAAAAGSHVGRRAHESHHRSHHSHHHCPSGYIVSTYYTTVTVTPPSMPEPTTTIRLTSTVFVTDYLSASVAPYSPNSNSYSSGGIPNINNYEKPSVSATSTYQNQLPVYVPTSSVTSSSASTSASTSTSTSTSTSSSTSAQGAPSVSAKSSYTSPSLGGPYSGQATFYGGNMGGACSFSTYTLPSGIFGTALSSTNWDNSGNCGACISVTGPNGNSIKAMVCFCYVLRSSLSLYMSERMSVTCSYKLLTHNRLSTNARTVARNQRTIWTCSRTYSANSLLSPLVSST